MSKHRSRAEYLANAVSRARPWETAGVSRATWYRKRQSTETSPRHETGAPTHSGEISTHDIKHETGVRESDETSARRLAEARAVVEALYAQMAAERERRRDWYTQPVEGWRDGRLTIRNIARDETVVIRLDGDRKPRGRKPAAPAPRPWWEEN